LKTFTKVLVLIAELLGCLAVLVGAVWGAYFLIGLLPPNSGNDFIYAVVCSTLFFIAPALLALGYSLLVYVVLKNHLKRILIALLNGIGSMALFTGAYFLFTYDLIWYLQIAPMILIFALILSLVLLALRPKSLPKAETITEAAKEG
jgi:hypothetical protein